MKIVAEILVVLTCALPALGSQTGPEDKPKKKPAPAKVYTNDDLRRTRGVISVVGEPAPPAGEGKDAEPGRRAAKPEKTEEELRAERAAAAQKEMKALADRAAAIRKAMDEAQLELNDLSNYTFGGRRASLMQFLVDAQAELTKVDESMAALEERARREGTAISRP